ncbi:unnamed protein product [Phytomonas sp. EM1]|nr:unnamed protein product [Phytomonas sp. EM1]|eukprot:CCW63170.1 unnamed protein product [Phytomonas sp. isolate EM1]
MALLHHRAQEPLGADYARAVAQMNLAVGYLALGELAFAERALQDALAGARTAKATTLETIALGNLGVVALRMGNMHAAQASLEQALEQCSLAGDKSGAAICLLLLGEIYLGINDYPHALFYFEHALRLGGESEISDIVAVARVNIGITKGNAAMRGCVAGHARAMGHEIDIETIISVLPR